MERKYTVTREFIAGNLKGLTYTENTSVKFNVGFICSKPIGGSAYKIIKVVTV